MSQAQKEAIEIHIRTYRSALRSSKEIALSTLIPTYLKMEPLLHSLANSSEIDQEALIYSLNRFPKEILEAKTIVIGQTKEVFLEAGYDLKKWRKVEAPERRRPSFFDPKTKTLACFAASISDVDDIVNLAIALQIELNKAFKEKVFQLKKRVLASELKEFKIRLLAGTWVNFAKTAQSWWQTTAKRVKDKFDLSRQPLVFISSNNHSLINLSDGFCLKQKKEILNQFQEKKEEKPYFLYFASQFVFETDKRLWQKKLAHEKKLGIIRIPSQTNLHLETQIIPGKLISRKLKDLIVINIEYPLGFAAFHLLEEILENTQQMKGAYILGKASALNTKIGDILIPKIVFDEHSQNTYMINNSFNNNFPYQFKSGSVLDNQKLVSVLGTLLENKNLFESYSQKEFNIVEMEAGPYLGAITQAVYPKSLPQKTVVDLHQIPFDLGLIYYSSDNPYILSQTLGKTLGLAGIEATYLSTQAIIDRIKKI